MNIDKIIKSKTSDFIKSNSDESLYRLLYLLRKKLGLSRKTVALMLGVSEAKIHCLETGKTKRPDFTFVSKVGKLYGIQENFLMKKIQEFIF